MENTASIYYANELFVFEPEKKHFLAHEEFLYKFRSSPESVNIFLSTPYLNELKKLPIGSAPAQDLQTIIDSKDQKVEIEEEKKEVLPDEGQDWGAELQEQNPEFQKHNFDLFLEIVDIGMYTNKFSYDEYFGLYYAWLGPNNYKLAAYFHFRNKGFEIESGCTFAFDFLLYKQGTKDVGLLNRVERTHSEYGVYIVYEDLGPKITFKDLHRKHRVAHNYSKKKENNEDKAEKVSVDSLLEQFAMLDMIYSRTQLHAQKKR